MIDVKIKAVDAESPSSDRLQLLMGSDDRFITGSDILMDGGVTASYWYGELAPQ